MRKSLLPALAALLFLMAGLAPADEIDDLLAKRPKNMEKVKRMRIEMTIETERPALNGKPARRMQVGYSYELRHRNRHDPDPAKRYDAEVEMQVPLQMRFRLENGVFSYLTPSGKWLTRDLPLQAREFMDGLADRHVGDVASAREHFDIRRNKAKDNFWGSRKGLLYVPKGRSKLYTRKEEQVDVESGQAMLTELFDDKGKCIIRIKVNKLGKHNGVFVPEDMESESFGVAGRIWQRTKATKVEVDTE